MRRRDVLAALGTASVVGVAGCVSAGAGSPRPETRRRTVSIDSVDEIDDEHQVAIDVDLLEAEITDGQTAHLRVTTTNEGSPRWFSVGDGMCAIFNRSDEMSDPEGVWLYRPEETQWLEREGKKWEHDGDPDEPRGFAAYGCGTTLYETGDSVATKYVLWDDYVVDGYLPPGDYRWEVPVRAWTDREGRYPDEPATEFTWGFSLTVELPEASVTAESDTT